MSKKNIIETNIPKNNDGKYDWKHCIGCYIDFQYDDIYGRLYIKERTSNGKLLVEYNGDTKELKADKLLRLQIGDLIGLITKDFIFDIGYKYQDTKGHYYTVVEQYRDAESGRKMCKCLCHKCNNLIPHTESDIKSKRGCPYCSNQKVLVGFNDMWTTDSWLAAWLKNPEDGYLYCSGSNKKLDWKCPDCGEELYGYTPNLMRSYQGSFPCKKCGKGTSYPNRFMYNLLLELNEEFIPEKSFAWSNGKIYDFYLPNRNMIIEMHGKQHYTYTGLPTSVEYQQKNDKYKKELAEKNGIEYYIIIDARKSDASFIFDNILNSELSNHFNLSNIDVQSIHEKSTTKYIFEVIDLMKQYNDVRIVAKKLKVCVQTVYKYIYLAEELGWYVYDKEEQKEKRTKNIFNTFYHRHGKSFMCIETGHAFGNYPLLENNSETVFGRRMDRACICVSIKKNTMSYGYHWKYITHEEFNNIKSKSPDKAFGDFFDLELDETNKSA